MLQVTGSSFFLWVLESYNGMVRQVETIMSEVKYVRNVMNKVGMSVDCHDKIGVNNDF